MVRLSRGLQPRVLDRKRAACMAIASETPWGAAIGALREMLGPPDVLRAAASVILSDHFVRYLVLPWSAELVSDAEQLEFARARLAKVFGETAQRWSVLINPSPAGQPRLAVAVERALIEALEEVVAAARLKLTSIQPAFVARFNAAHSRLAPDAWIVIAERGRLVLAHIAGGQWRSVRTRPVNGAAIPLAQVLEQERMLVASDVQAKVYVGQLDDVSIDLTGVQAEDLPAWDTARDVQVEPGLTLTDEGRL
jgi:hypothetical protein